MKDTDDILHWARSFRQFCSQLRTLLRLPSNARLHSDNMLPGNMSRPTYQKRNSQALNQPFIHSRDLRPYSLSESVCMYASVCLRLAILLPCQSSNSINTCWSRRLALKNSSTFFLAFLALLWLVQGRVEIVTDPQAFESVEFTDSINSLMAVATIDPLFWSALLSQHSINSHQTGLIITKLE